MEKVISGKRSTNLNGKNVLNGTLEKVLNENNLVTLKLSADQVRYFNQLNVDEKKAIETLVGSWLKEGGFNLLAYMNYMGNAAQMNGLTPEIFEEISPTNKSMKQLNFSVTDVEAERYENLSATKKELFNRLISDWLQEDSWSFKTSMEFVSFRAQKRGLTPEILQEILQEENP